MELIFSYLHPFTLAFALLIAMGGLADCYDPLDPYGNITVTFDIHQWTNDGYVARVTIQNYHQYRHVDQPGWKIGWTWADNEIILSMSGAFATEQGNCSDFKFQSPHSCEKDPVIVDLGPDASPQNMTDACCRGGLLSSYTINPANSFSFFEVTVGNLGMNASGHAPRNLTLWAPGPGYTCGLLEDVDPTVSLEIGGRRQVQVFRTWKSTCTYSTFLANKTPVCCVSLSTFYNPKVTPCPVCSCGCRDADKSTALCISQINQLQGPDFIKSQDIVHCSDHMCPVRVHWHVQNNYVGHWRVKVTVSNYNYKRNYSNWNVVVQHPGFSQKATAYSFNSSVLPSAGFSEKVALFWGISYNNEELLQAGENQVGSVTTQILLEKDSESFTLSNGWALPRRVYFNGENCEMPLPDTFPMLPNAASSSLKPVNNCFFILQILFFLTFTSQLINLLGFDKQLNKFCLSLQPHFLIHNPLSF
ncbi:hypothetical protein AB3S75_043017 [Citrus x aurantiifolia]